MTKLLAVSAFTSTGVFHWTLRMVGSMSSTLVISAILIPGDPRRCAWAHRPMGFSLSVGSVLAMAFLGDHLAESERGAFEAAVVKCEVVEDPVANDWGPESGFVGGENVHWGCCGGCRDPD